MTDPSRLSDQDLVTDLLDYAVDLTVWEADFVEDMADQVVRGRLTPLQREKLEQIYDERM